jgi:hypothetical protein
MATDICHDLLLSQNRSESTMELMIHVMHLYCYHIPHTLSCQFYNGHDICHDLLLSQNMQCVHHESCSLAYFSTVYQMREQLSVKEMFYGLECSYKAEGNDKVKEVIHKIKN